MPLPLLARPAHRGASPSPTRRSSFAAGWIPRRAVCHGATRHPPAPPSPRRPVSSAEFHAPPRLAAPAAIARLQQRHKTPSVHEGLAAGGGEREWCRAAGSLMATGRGVTATGG